jgi:hypothetical protein
MNNEWETKWKEGLVVLFEKLSQYLPGESQEYEE